MPLPQPYRMSVFIDFFCRRSTNPPVKIPITSCMRNPNPQMLISAWFASIHITIYAMLSPLLQNNVGVEI